MTVNLTVDQLL